MKIVQGDAVPPTAGLGHREGPSSYRRLLDGEGGSLENFSLVITRSPGRYSPRHRHNFEQFRYQLSGVADFGRTGVMEPGMLGYFPEGTYYGPQSQGQGEHTETLALQFGGPSGSGYLGHSARDRGTEELRKSGEFRQGAFRRNDDVPGKRNVDAFEAIWEYFNQRPLVYPKPRYGNPILIYPDSFKWQPVDGAPGIYVRTLGIFSECRAGVSQAKLEAGARHVVRGGREICFVLSGSGVVEAEPFRRWTTLYLDRGEQAVFAADETAVILSFRLPDLESIRFRRRKGRGFGRRRGKPLGA